MNKFEKGDKVIRTHKCLINSDIKEGEIYTVKEDCSGGVLIIEEYDGLFCPERFELAPTPNQFKYIKVQDRLVNFTIKVNYETTYQVSEFKVGGKKFKVTLEEITDE